MKSQDCGAFAALDGDGHGQSGISRLEYFAAAALAILGDSEYIGAPEQTAVIVFDIAEAMCAEAEKRRAKQ